MRQPLKSLLLALVNATLMLAIILTVAGIFLLYKVQSFTADVISDVKIELLREIDEEIEGVSETVKAGERNLRRISERLDEIIRRPEVTLSPAVEEDIRSLSAELKALRQSVNKLTESRNAMSDEAIRKVFAALADTYIRIRKCQC